MKNAIYAGSFDPFTNGHLYVLCQAAKIFDKVYVAISTNPNKKRRIDRNIMKEAMEKVLKNRGITNAEVVELDGLVVDLAKEKQADFLIRGLRNGTDYEYEENMAIINSKISGVETIYFRAGKTSHISSSAVMELLQYGRDVSKWVPEEILEKLR